MSETVPGGRYLTSDGRLVNAHGRPLDPDPLAVPPLAPSAVADAHLPEGFPHRDALEGAGFTTVDRVREASDATLRAIPTIGPAAVRAIRAAE